MGNKKTNWALYIIVICFSFATLLFLNGSLVFSVPFLGALNTWMMYIVLSLVSLVIGGLTWFVLKKMSDSNKAMIIGCSTVSFLVSVVLAVVLFVIQKLSMQMKAFTEVGVAPSGIVELFGAVPNPMFTAILAILGFNLVPVIMFFKDKKHEIKNLLIYLYGFIVFFVIYFGITFLISEMIFY